MVRFSPVVAVVTVAACALLVAGTAAQQTPTFRSRADTVRVFVTVTDGAGKVVTNLSRDDFEIKDNGAVQPITQFDNTPQPLRFIVMLDVSGSMEGNLPLLRGASEQLFRRLLPEDAVRVGTFGQDVAISPEFTHDTTILRAALPTFISPDAPTPLWRGLDEAMAAFAGLEDERRVVLVLSDGRDSPPTSFRKLPISQAEVIDRARRDDVMIYAVAMHSRSSQPRQPAFGIDGLRQAVLDDMPDPGLAKVADETGGGYTEIRPGGDLASAFAGVADELHSQYLLGYATPKQDGKMHDIKVQMRQRGLKPRARPKYLAPKP